MIMDSFPDSQIGAHPLLVLLTDYPIYEALRLYTPPPYPITGFQRKIHWSILPQTSKRATLIFFNVRVLVSSFRF